MAGSRLWMVHDRGIRVEWKGFTYHYHLNWGLGSGWLEVGCGWYMTGASGWSGKGSRVHVPLSLELGFGEWMAGSRLWMVHDRGIRVEWQGFTYHYHLNWGLGSGWLEVGCGWYMTGASGWSGSARTIITWIGVWGVDGWKSVVDGTWQGFTRTIIT